MDIADGYEKTAFSSCTDLHTHAVQITRSLVYAGGCNSSKFWIKYRQCFHVIIYDYLLAGR